MKTINDAIKEEISKMPPENGREPILDGITNPEFYAAAPKKILFILKEAYDEGKNSHGQGGWDHCKYFDDSKLSYSELKHIKTHDRVSKLVPCIFKNILFSEFKKAKLPEYEIMKAFRSIAWVNVGKYPAPKGKKTSPESLQKAYNFWKSILFKQIESYKPEIIIFGGSFYLFKEDLMNNFELKEVIAPWVFRDKLNRLYIGTGHPSQRISDEEYIDSIINAIRTAENKSL